MNLWIYPLVAAASFGVGFAIGQIARRVVRQTAFLGVAGFLLVMLAFVVTALIGGPMPLPSTMLFADAMGILLGAFLGSSVIDQREGKLQADALFTQMQDKIEQIGSIAQCINARQQELQTAQVSLAPLEMLAVAEADKPDFLAVLSPHLESGRTAVKTATNALEVDIGRMAQPKQELQELLAKVDQSGAARYSQQLRYLSMLAALLLAYKEPPQS